MYPILQGWWYFSHTGKFQTNFAEVITAKPSFEYRQCKGWSQVVEDICFALEKHI